MANVLLIDEHEGYHTNFLGMLKRLGIPAHAATGLDKGMRHLEKTPCDLVFLNAHLQGRTNLKHLPDIRDTPGNPEVVILSDKADPKTAENSILQGAWDFLVKPIPFVTLEQCISRCLRHREARANFISAATFHRGPIVGESRQIRAAMQQMAVAASGMDSVLLLGETGTGKELFARAVHDNSDRSNKAFTVIDCTNLPTTLAQSLLFGHIKGTFTDAKETRDGLFKQADGGTIFLDEIADLDETIQKSLLRVLQERAFRPLSSNKEVTSDFRLVAATNRDLDAMVQAKTFRADLYYRLKTCTIQLPPLREREGDVGILVNHYVEKICKDKKMPLKNISRDYLQAMQCYPWPGNVRELINAVRHSVSNCFDSDSLHTYHLPKEIRIHMLTTESAPPPDQVAAIPDMSEATEAILKSEHFPTLKEVRQVVVDRMEAEYLIELMARVQGDIPQACEISDLSRARLYSLLRKHDIQY